MIHAIITAVGCMASVFGFVVLLCCEGTDLITDFQNFVLCVAWLGGMMLAYYGISGFDWEIISHARRKRNARVKMRHLKKRALRQC